MTDDGPSLPRNSSLGSHFLVTCVENSAQDDDAVDVNSPSTNVEPPNADLSPSTRNVVFKIGDSSVFGPSQPSSVLLKPTTADCASLAPPVTDSSSAHSSSAPLLQQSHSSRFHIVKLENNPYKRGRWLCKDKHEPKMQVDLPEKRRTAAVMTNLTDETPVCKEPPTAAVVEPTDSALSVVIDQPVDQPLAAPSSVANESAAADAHSSGLDLSEHPVVNGQPADGDDKIHHHHSDNVHLDSLRLHGTSAAFIDSVVEQFGTDQIVKELGSQTGTGAAAGASPDAGVTTSNVAIDNKIEQAMDLVKTHLLYAVREEVDLFKERIERLEYLSRRLEAENKLLREHVSPEVLVEMSAFLASKGIFMPAAKSSSSAAAPTTATTTAAVSSKAIAAATATDKFAAANSTAAELANNKDGGTAG